MVAEEEKEGRGVYKEGDEADANPTIARFLFGGGRRSQNFEAHVRTGRMQHHDTRAPFTLIADRGLIERQLEGVR